MALKGPMLPPGWGRPHGYGSSVSNSIGSKSAYYRTWHACRSRSSHLPSHLRYTPPTTGRTNGPIMLSIYNIYIIFLTKARNRMVMVHLLLLAVPLVAETAVACCCCCVCEALFPDAEAAAETLFLVIVLR